MMNRKPQLRQAFPTEITGPADPLIVLSRLLLCAVAVVMIALFIHDRFL